MRVVGHSDLAGHGDGMHIQLKDGYGFVGHMGEAGTTILDLRDPSDPRVVGRMPASTDTHAHKVQIPGRGHAHQSRADTATLRPARAQVSPSTTCPTLATRGRSHGGRAVAAACTGWPGGRDPWPT